MFDKKEKDEILETEKEADVVVEEEKPDGFVSWADVPFKKFDKKEFASLMEQLGIITYEDAQKSRRKIFGLLQKLYGVDVATIIEFARKQDKK